MIAFKILLVALASGLATAWPEPTAAAYLDARGAVNCAKVTGVLGVLKKIGPPATSFCSSFLKIRETKTTTTVTPDTVTRTTSTTTVTTSKISCDLQKRDELLDYRAIAPADPDAQGLEKRRDIRYLLGGYAAAKISEGCRCLNLQPKTTTVTKTAAVPTTNVVATSTECAVKICRPNGVGQSCIQNDDCCLGACGVQFSVPTCCSPRGADCDLRSPGTCCSAACRTKGFEDFQGTCL